MIRTRNITVHARVFFFFISTFFFAVFSPLVTAQRGSVFISALSYNIMYCRTSKLYYVCPFARAPRGANNLTCWRHRASCASPRERKTAKDSGHRRLVVWLLALLSACIYNNLYTIVRDDVVNKVCDSKRIWCLCEQIIRIINVRKLATSLPVNDLRYKRNIKTKIARWHYLWRSIIFDSFFFARGRCSKCKAFAYRYLEMLKN
jgi:hypothetical protein